MPSLPPPTRKLLLVVLLSFLVTSHASSTQDRKKESLENQGTLRSTTRLVVVDVVVTDSKGQPVTDLKAEDFTVMESGALQKISDFSFQHPGQVRTSQPRPLPSNVVSNVPTFQSSALNVILFDGLNGEFASQAFAKDQLIKFFNDVGPAFDRPVALFVLEPRIRLLQDFTTDVSALKTAMEKYKQRAQNANTESFESRESAFATRGDFHTNDRNIESTLNQLNVLAKLLSAYPGRKNVIWLSESFPLDLYPDQVIQSGVGGNDLRTVESTAMGGPSAFERMRDSGAFHDWSELVKKVADAMMNAQVAVYTVDSAGLSKNDHLASQHTANDIAERTGGKAFHNTNDLSGSLRTGLNDGSTYYTLAYYPENKRWDGQFRAIQIKTDRSGINLRYRVGYYALDPEKIIKEDKDSVSEDFSRSLQVDSPAATAVHFQAGVVPPSARTNNRLVVNFAIDPHTVHFERSSDGMEHASLSCTVWAYGKDKDKPTMSPGDTSKADLKPEVYEQLMKQYYPCKQELDLKPGAYTLRLGVLDRNSNQMGTTTAQVTVPQ